MVIDPLKSSRWMTDFHRQLLCGKHVLLHGNVEDQFLFTPHASAQNGDGDTSAYVSMAHFLRQYFTSSGYEVVGEYDVADGLRLLDVLAMRPIFDAISTGAPARAASSSPQPVPAGHSRGATTTQLPGSNGGQSPAAYRTTEQDLLRARQPSFANRNEALTAIRNSITQPRRAVAFVLEFSDKLVGDPERAADEEELRLLVQLRKMTNEAAYVADGHRLAGLRNALVIVAAHLAGVPRWFYHNNPSLALVHVARPPREERTVFAARFLANFHGHDLVEPHKRAEVIQEFADLTDGLTNRDLDAVRRTSLVHQLSIAQPKKLINHHLYGKREDPWENLDMAKIQGATAALESHVKGQKHAISAVINMLVNARIGLDFAEVNAQGGKPKGVFFFVGPTGVGKTELAKALSAFIFGDDGAFKRFDMSEFNQPHSGERLTGSPPGYVGYDEGGELTSWVRQKPFSVILFDEIEKADKTLMNKFLQVLEDGRLTDGKGETVSFAQTVLIFTSNCGSDTMTKLQRAGEDGFDGYEQVEAHFKKAAREYFTKDLGRPELLNRFGDNILVFDVLRKEFMDAICHKFLDQLARNAHEKHGLEVMFDKTGLASMIRGYMAQGDNMQYGGRRIRTLMETHLKPVLNRWVLSHTPRRGSRLSVRATPDGSSIEVEALS